jgi:hypothetical protein
MLEVSVIILLECDAMDPDRLVPTFRSNPCTRSHCIAPQLTDTQHQEDLTSHTVSLFSLCNKTPDVCQRIQRFTPAP